MELRSRCGLPLPRQRFDCSRGVELRPRCALPLVYSDGEPLESEWHAHQLPLLWEVIRQAMVEAELARLRALLEERERGVD